MVDGGCLGQIVLEPNGRRAPGSPRMERGGVTLSRLIILLLLLGLPKSALSEDEGQSVHTMSGPEKSSPGGPNTPGESTVSTGSLVRVELTSGETLRGTLVSSDATSLVLKLPGAGRITLERGAVVRVVAADRTRVTEDGKLYRQDPNRTRYLYGPSALSLEAGEGYVSQKELFFTAVAYGVTDNITVLGGTVFPVLLGGEFIGILGTKFSYEVIEDRVHVAGGAEAFVAGLADLGMVGFIFASATYGNADRHLTLTLGKPFQFDKNARDLGPAIITASGAYRTSAKFAMIMENWFILPDASADFFRFHGVAGRFILGSWALDVGGIFVNDIKFPIPWLDLTWNW